MIKCPKCKKKMIIDLNDSDIKILNFDGKNADAEVFIYCEYCEEPFLFSIPVKIKLKKNKAEYIE